MSLVLDAMGSDTHPGPEIEGALIASRELNEEIILAGREDRLARLLGTSHPGVRIVHAPDVLEMTDKPIEGTRLKPNNSLAAGLRLVKSGEARAFVTAGNTGGAWFNALRTLGRMRGVDRAPLAPVIPTLKGRCVLVDSGANVDCRPEFLHQFAVLASAYARALLGAANPRVGLLSNGEEDEKGNELVKAAGQLLRGDPRINYMGNVEPRQVYEGQVDVLVADGFAGNVFLKTSEAVAQLMMRMLRESIQSRPLWMLGGAMAKNAFRQVRDRMNPSEVGAAVLLGVDGLVLIGHGHSDARAIFNALKLAQKCADQDLVGQIRKSFTPTEN